MTYDMKKSKAMSRTKMIRLAEVKEVKEEKNNGIDNIRF
jgi:hypothetical protein